MSSNRVSELDALSASNTGEPACTQAAVEDLSQSLLAATRQLQRLQDENEQKARLANNASQILSLELIDLLDRLDGWLHSSDAALAKEDPVTAKWVLRLDMVGKIITKSLGKRGLTPLDLRTAPAGTITVVGRIERSNIQSEQVEQVIERAWMLNGELIRKGSVIIAVPGDCVESPVETTQPSFERNADDESSSSGAQTESA